MELSTICVDTKEDQKVINKYTKQRRELVTELAARGFPCEGAKNQPVDLMWSASGRSVMLDIATPDDMIAKVNDGRLHTQSQSMLGRDPMLWGYLVEGSASSDGITVGYGPHAWSWERFDNLLVSLQAEGATIVRSPHPNRTASRIGSFYTWTGKDSFGSWHKPKPHHTLTGVYLDDSWRRQIEALMSLFPGMGELIAVRLLSVYKYADIVCVDNETKARWTSVKGVGPKLAESWYTVLTEDLRGTTS